MQISVNHLQTFVAATEKYNDEYRKSYLKKVQANQDWKSLDNESA